MSKKAGTCKLTDKKGTFVKSHLIPRALTRPRSPGIPFIQAGSGTLPVRRWDSWYDAELTIRKGENILADLDDWAISELRKHQLIWSAWEGATSLHDKVELIPGTSMGLRTIQGVDPIRLRLFFLSLLWRAAATTRPEFSEIILPPDDLEKLRLMILEGDPGQIDFYPVQLIQLYTLGETHNQTPIVQTKTIPSYEDTPERQIPIFRFYFDGLIMHFHRQASDEGYTVAQGSLNVGYGNELTVTAFPYEASSQHNMLLEIQRNAEENWPEVMKKLSAD